MSIYQEIAQRRKNGEKLVLVTAVEKKGEGPVEVGKKMLVFHGGAIGTVGGGALEYEAREEAKRLLVSKKSKTIEYYLNEGKVLKNAKTLPMVCGGVVTLFFEYIGAMEDIYIFGAGHVAQALTNVLKTMNFHVTVIDDRKEVIDVFQGADQKHHMSFVEFIEHGNLPKETFVVVSTPSHKYDYHVINHVLKYHLNPKYIGMLCSKEKLKDYLEKTYHNFGKDVDLSNFYSPIGLDIGGGSPEEIAISISAEILAIHHHKKNHNHMRGDDNDPNRYW